MRALSAEQSLGQMLRLTVRRCAAGYPTAKRDGDSAVEWWPGAESNHRHAGLQSRALTRDKHCTGYHAWRRFALGRTIESPAWQLSALRITFRFDNEPSTYNGAIGRDWA
jgi:hypothetical protein